MGVNKYDIVYYDYITNLYRKLNTARKKFKFDEVSLNKKQYEYHTASDITRLENFLIAMKSNKYLKSVDTSKIEGSNRPVQYNTYLRPYDFNTIEAIIDQMQGICANDAVFYSGGGGGTHTYDGVSSSFVWGSDSGATNTVDCKWTGQSSGSNTTPGCYTTSCSGNSQCSLSCQHGGSGSGCPGYCSYHGG